MTDKFTVRFHALTLEQRQALIAMPEFSAGAHADVFQERNDAQAALKEARMEPADHIGNATEKVKTVNPTDAELIEILGDELNSDDDAYVRFGRKVLAQYCAVAVEPSALTDEEIMEKAHRACTTYAHVERVKYGFSNADLLQFIRCIETAAPTPGAAR